MAIRVAPGAADLPADLAGRFLVLLRDPADPELALAGLDAARADLLALGPAMVSRAVLSPDGPLLRVSSLDADEDALQSVAEVLVAALGRAGVHDATLELLEPIGALDLLDRTQSAAVLRLFPHPAGADGVIPPQWLEVATEWVLGDATGHETVGIRLLGATFEVATRDAAATLHDAVGARAWCDLVHGRLDRRIRTASLTFGRAPHLALAAGGPDCNASALLARFELLQEVAREVRGVAYACVDLEETFGDVGTGVPGSGWPARGGADPNAVVGQVADVVVPDAFPVQVLGPGHLLRFRERGREEIDGEPLDDGRVEVTLGEPTDWLPRFDARIDAVDHACKALAELLVTDAELTELVDERPAVAVGDAPAAARGGPDLDHITLDAVPHPRRGLRLTLLELAAWIGHEPHSDAPRGVSPVLAAYARWYASGLDHADRQALKPFAARLAGTRARGLAPGPWRPLGSVEDARAWRAVDWLAREQASAWLRAAGLDASADGLMKVRRADGGHHARQLHLLDAALAELTAGGHPSPGDDAAWDDWEHAAEVSAWVAASEAAWVGIPDAVASAAELRALELVRGTGIGAPGDVAGTVTEQVRAAAMAAAAEEAWRLAGSAAAAAVDVRMADPDLHETVTAVPLSTAWERAGQGAATRAGVDRDAFELAVEQAEAAARGLLIDLIDSGNPLTGALYVAQRAAEASSGGALWSSARDLAHGVVGDAAWDAAERAANEAVDRVLRWAPQVVDRAVLVAVAREVSGAAARAAIARGGPEAIEPTLAVLRPAATDLFEALLTAK